MSDETINLFEDQTTFFTLDQEQIKQNILFGKLSKTSSSNKDDFLHNTSRYSNLIGEDEMEKLLENYISYTLNNLFISDVFNNYNDSESEEVSNFDNIPDSGHLIIEIPSKDKNQKKNSQFFESPTPEEENFLLNKKKKRDGNENKFSREDNARRGVARFFFNRYLKNIIEKMKKDCKCILYFNFFPEKFIFEGKIYFRSSKKN